MSPALKTTIFPPHCAPFQIEMKIFVEGFAEPICHSKIHVGVEFIFKLNSYLRENKILGSTVV